MTGTSGPGIALKSEGINLAVMTELPLVVVDVQRVGPSTGIPTKTEQGDLLQVLFGRNSDSPVCVLAPLSPGDCFYTAIEAVRLAYQFMTPVIILSDSYLANTAEPWPVPEMAQLERIPVPLHTDPATFQPYQRDPKTLARQRVLPGMAGTEHRIGGLEKADVTGAVSYDGDNHERMTNLRAEKVGRIAQFLPKVEVEGPADADVLVLGWGSTRGAILTAVQEARAQGASVATAHLRHLHPFPPTLGEVVRRYRKVLIPENNRGQLRLLVRAAYLVDAVGLNRINGQPFAAAEITSAIQQLNAQR